MHKAFITYSNDLGPCGGIYSALTDCEASLSESATQAVEHLALASFYWWIFIHSLQYGFVSANIWLSSRIIDQTT